MEQVSDGGACLAGELRFAEEPGGEADRGERVNLAHPVQNQSPVLVAVGLLHGPGQKGELGVVGAIAWYDDDPGQGLDRTDLQVAVGSRLG